MCQKCTVKAVLMLAAFVGGDPKLAEFTRAEPMMKHLEQLLVRLGYEQTRDDDHFTDTTCALVADTDPGHALDILKIIGPWQHALADVNSLMIDVVQSYAGAGHPACQRFMAHHEKNIIERPTDPTGAYGGVTVERSGPIAPPR